MKNNKAEDVSQSSSSRQSGSLFLPKTCQILKKGLKRGITPRDEWMAEDKKQTFSLTTFQWKCAQYVLPKALTSVDHIRCVYSIELKSIYWYGKPLLSHRNFCNDNDLVSSGMVLGGTLWAGLFFVLVFLFDWLVSGHPGWMARCQTASRVLRPSVWGPTLAGEMCGRFLLN